MDSLAAVAEEGVARDVDEAGAKGAGAAVAAAKGEAPHLPRAIPSWKSIIKKNSRLSEEPPKRPPPRKTKRISTATTKANGLKPHFLTVLSITKILNDGLWFPNQNS